MCGGSPRPDQAALAASAEARGARFGRYRCLTLRYSLLLSVWVDPSAEHVRTHSRLLYSQNRLKHELNTISSSALRVFTVRRIYRGDFTEFTREEISALDSLPLWDNSKFYLKVLCSY